MNLYNKIELYKKLRTGEKKAYVSLAAHDNFDRNIVDTYSLYFKEDIIDQTDEALKFINDTLEKIILEDSLFENKFEELIISCTPFLFYNPNTIVNDKEKVVAESDYLDYYQPFIRLQIDFITTKNINGKVETIYRFGQEPKEFIVDYNKFAFELPFNYRSFFELSRAILEEAKDNDKFPNLYAYIMTKEDTIRYQEEAENYKQKSL